MRLTVVVLGVTVLDVHAHDAECCDPAGEPEHMPLAAAMEHGEPAEDVVVGFTGRSR